MAQRLGSTSEMVAEGFVREVDRWTAIQARLRMMICAIALEREKIRSGRYPSSLFETSLATNTTLIRDPYSGRPFIYSVTDEGYLMESAPVWQWGGAKNANRTLEWQIPVSAAAMSDSE